MTGVKIWDSVQVNFSNGTSSNFMHISLNKKYNVNAIKIVSGLPKIPRRFLMSLYTSAWLYWLSAWRNNWQFYSSLRMYPRPTGVPRFCPKPTSRYPYFQICIFCKHLFYLVLSSATPEVWVSDEMYWCWIAFDQNWSDYHILFFIILNSAAYNTGS